MYNSSFVNANNNNNILHCTYTTWLYRFLEIIVYYFSDAVMGME
jgi:hypothetical protein